MNHKIELIEAGTPCSMVTSQEMATLIADALIDANILKSDDLEKAIEIAEEEIRVRLALGNEIKIENNFVRGGTVI